LSRREGRGVFAGLHPMTRRLDADELHPAVVPEGVEKADRVAPAPHAGDAGVRQPARGAADLLSRLLADDGLELAHHERIGMRAGDRANDVEGVTYRGDPVA